MGIYTIYKATNLINGKSYIGFTSQLLKNRKKHHKCVAKTSNKKFARAIRKYGFESFVWTIVYKGDDKYYTFHIMEPFFISAFDSFHSGYNQTTGGGVFPTHKPRKNFTHTKETKEKISTSKTGIKIGPQTKEHIKKRTSKRIGTKHSAESKLKNSLSQKGRKRLYRPDGSFYYTIP